jgi:phage replication initiation protein
MSEMSVCIYDKAKEQLLPAHVHWVRSELRAKKDRAHELVRLFIKEGVGAVAGVLWGYLDFKNIGTDSNRSRWESCSWWADFLGVCGKLRLSIQAVVRTLQRVKDWLLRQVAPSLALVVEAEAGALDSVVALLSSGKERWKASHRSLLVAEGVAI